MDHFCASVNLEVQWASEATISAVERNGGVITTTYFDPISLEAAVNPVTFFKRGLVLLLLIYLCTDILCSWMFYHTIYASDQYYNSLSPHSHCSHHLTLSGYTLFSVNTSYIYISVGSTFQTFFLDFPP